MSCEFFLCTNTFNELAIILLVCIVTTYMGRLLNLLQRKMRIEKETRIERPFALRWNHSDLPFSKLLSINRIIALFLNANTMKYNTIQCITKAFDAMFSFFTLIMHMKPKPGKCASFWPFYNPGTVKWKQVISTFYNITCNFLQGNKNIKWTNAFGFLMFEHRLTWCLSRTKKLHNDDWV